jgi:hypothetical protein
MLLTSLFLGAATADNTAKIITRTIQNPTSSAVTYLKRNFISQIIGNIIVQTTELIEVSRTLL